MKLKIFSFQILLLTFLLSSLSFSQEYNLFSPDKKNEIKINTEKNISFSVYSNNHELISPSLIALKLEDGKTLGSNPVISDTHKKIVDTAVYPVIKQKSEKIINSYNELKLNFKGDYSLVFRAFNNGVAYRFETGYKDSIKIKSEVASFNFATDDTVYFPQEESFISHNERLYKKLPLNKVEPDSFCSLPALVTTHFGTKVLITEADLEDYPGLWLKVNKEHTLTGIHPNYVLKAEVDRDKDSRIIERADYIANTIGTRKYPWRVMMIAETDSDLILNQMVCLLSEPLQLKETSWIKPGKVAWDWWNALNIYGVDFKSGINTKTYKYYIDFASKYNIEYIILDEGWYKSSATEPGNPNIPGDITDVIPAINMKELLSYAEEKNVGIILWVAWKSLDRQMNKALDLYEKLGVKGIKVDFMQRDDQLMVNYYWRTAKEAAKRKLLVDFHGSYKPSGLRRAYPNVINREGVRGLEHCKWSDLFVPDHEVTIPFIRMSAGPMDYTPGAMVNAQKDNYRPIFARPMSMGTRCHQLAMYVIYEAPLQMLADNPSNYLKEPECMQFLGKVPTVWDETKVLYAKTDDYVVIARRNGNTWYVGAMSGKYPKEFNIDFSFLNPGEYTMDCYQDGVNADKFGNDYKKTTLKITKDKKLDIKLAPAGGWAAIIYMK